MEAHGVKRKLAAILAADVKGYSRLMGEDEVATLRTLTASREIIDSLILQYQGRVVGSAGDSVLAEFTSVVDAVQCAVEIQHALKVRNADLPEHRRMEFRIGINLGDVMIEGEQIYGDGVNIAARLESLAEAGGICISGTVYEQIENKLQLKYEYLGEQAVKNIAKPVRVWRVQLEEPESSKFQVQGSKSKEFRRVGIAHRSWAMATVTGLLLIAGTVVAVWYFTRPTLRTPDSALWTDIAPGALPLPDKPSLVVLPFVNMSEDPKQEYFSDGITEDITSDLSKISNLFVIARNSAFTYKGKAVKVQDIGKELGVRYVLEGSVRKADSEVRITAQLIDTTTGGHLWSERYDRPLREIFALQDEIVHKIVTTLKLQLTLWEHGLLVRKRTESLEAYDYYLRAREYHDRYTKEAHTQERQLLEKALELDPQYAEAYVRLGLIFTWEWIAQWNQDPQVLEQAFALAQKAVTLDDSLPQAYQLLSHISRLQKKIDQAVVEAERAVTLDPNDAEGYAWLAQARNAAGQPEKAKEAVEKAMRLNPRYPAWYSMFLGGAYSTLGQDEQAIATLKEGVIRNPNYLWCHVLLASIYGRVGQEEEAQAEAAEILRLSPNFSLEGARQIFFKKNPEAVERFIDGLRKAGLK